MTGTNTGHRTPLCGDHYCYYYVCDEFINIFGDRRSPRAEDSNASHVVHHRGMRSIWEEIILMVRWRIWYVRTSAEFGHRSSWWRSSRISYHWIWMWWNAVVVVVAVVPLNDPMDWRQTTYSTTLLSIEAANQIREKSHLVFGFAMTPGHHMCIEDAHKTLNYNFN